MDGLLSLPRGDRCEFSPGALLLFLPGLDCGPLHLRLIAYLAHPRLFVGHALFLNPLLRNETTIFSDLSGFFGGCDDL